MAGDGTSFEIDIPVNAAGVEPAAAAVARLADRLTSAQSAAQQAADAVRAGESAYKSSEAAANSAAKALEKIGLAVDAQKGKLAKLAEGSGGSVDIGAYQAAERALAKLTAKQEAAAVKSSAAASALTEQASALDKLKSSAASASDAEDKLGKSVSKAKENLKAQTDLASKMSGSGKVNEMAEAFGKLGGPLGSLGQKAFGSADAMKKLSSSLGAAGPYAAVAIAIAAIVAGAVALSAAAIAGVASIGAWAVGLADAARSSALLSDGITGTVKGGRQLDAAIADLETRVPQTADELKKMAGELAKTGLEGDALTAALEDSATSAAKLKFGPDFAKGANSLTKLTERLRSRISVLFSGLKIDSLLSGISKIVDLFSSTESTGKAISVVFESLFQPLIDGLNAFIPKFVSAFIQFEIMAMKAMIAIKPWGSTIVLVAEAFGILALGIIAIAAIVVIGIIAPFAAAAALFTVVIAGIIHFWDTLNAAGAAVISFGATIMSGIGAALSWLASVSLSDIGINLIAGLIGGITGAGPGVLGALSGIVSGAIGGVKSLLGIASPSKVFKEIGGFTGEGMVVGVDDSAADVQSSLEAMVTPPELAPAAAPVAAGAAEPAAPAPAAAAPGGAGGVYQITINAAGGDGASIADALRAVLADLGAQAGTAVPA